ncbi:UbiX family flavin prenyltransferase [Clostridium sp. SYSU_GA19001]|uniref:UbiX family flavin prenyltransferase n=1 Tax=Clostridium caldaquaticum TaxID=2940653 RepID=UPI002076E579|nr:UbiX family flavin prenyltransferase [Clostridium caldaquaticum]MCM8710319.1 UbiX family flavin prenyltransferase [Clostridium caldaquaticum]
MEIVVGMTGATGAIYSVRLLETLKKFTDINVHLIISQWAQNTLVAETNYNLDYVKSLAHEVYDNSNMGAKISSGSFLTNAMIILPCSMKTLSSIANGYCDSLIARAADITIKEGRKLILSPRETPLNSIHLENMLKLSRLGVRIVPPMPAFYTKPDTIDDIVNHQVMKLLDQLNLNVDNAKRWNGFYF